MWEGYAARLFISFGELTPSSHFLPSGGRRRSHGEFDLTNMLSETSWVLTLNGHFLADSDSQVNRRNKALQRLLGKRLLALHIDQQSQSTVVEFSRGVTLTTAVMPGSREHHQHWLLRISEKEWRPVALMGTTYRWRWQKYC
ncbi:MAG: hypothetical protein NTW28_10850 [Candidatus Solibacter sp.]|nr:hypothetical protein [Candidatus Solibacter sp.]